MHIYKVDKGARCLAITTTDLKSCRSEKDVWDLLWGKHATRDLTFYDDELLTDWVRVTNKIQASGGFTPELDPLESYINSEARRRNICYAFERGGWVAIYNDEDVGEF